MYARYTTCGRAARGVGAEPQDGVGGHIQKMEGPAEATEDPAQGLGRINTNLVLPPGKPRCTSYYFKL